MTIITKSQHFVKVDMTAIIAAGHNAPFKIGYIMKDKSLLVALDADSEYVKVILSNDISFRLDMNGQNGSPAEIDGYTPTDNEDLARKLAELRTL